MKVLVQKVLNASVSVDNKLINKIDKGFLLFVGFTNSDNEEIIDNMVKKVINLRIFEDENGIMNKSILDNGGDILSISQFTLYANTKKGNRPSYIEALSSDKASCLYELFNKKLNEFVKVYDGVFGADMKISLTNDGPTTIMLEK
jgi:D-tyrosyl-tRNA(Tyr) deacylase